MSRFQPAQPVPYVPGEPVDPARPLWITQRLSPEEWGVLARVYPELGALPMDADFRRMPLMIMPPTVCSQAVLAIQLEIAAEDVGHNRVQEHFSFGSTYTEWVVMCLRGQGAGFITLQIYRYGGPAS